jgi:hypothetical protein
MDVGGGPDNAGGRGLVSGGGPNPNPRAAPTFMAERFCVRGRIGRPLPASAIVGSLDGCTESYSSSLRILRLRDVTGGRDEENEAGILGGSSRSRSWASRVAFRRVSHVIAIQYSQKGIKPLTLSAAAGPPVPSLASTGTCWRLSLPPSLRPRPHWHALPLGCTPAVI